MKLLGFAERPLEDLPEPVGREPAAGLREEDPQGYARLIDSLCEGRDDLAAWRDPLVRGEATVILTGQQPGLLGGPLYTLYKILTAVGVARRQRALGRPVLAAFWCVGDDTDHDEVAAASWPRREGPPARVRDLRSSAGGRLGQLEVGRMEEALLQILGDWPGAGQLREILPGVFEAARGEGWSGFLRRSLRSLLGVEPLLFVDGGDPAVIEASQPFLRRFVDLREELGREIGAAGSSLRGRGEEPRIGEEEGRRCLFVCEGKGRRVLGEAERPDRTGRILLLPNVVLRPALQEHLLPVERVVCGDAEIAYRALLDPVYARAGRPAAPLMRRFEATLFPTIWAVDPGVPDPARALGNPDAVLEEWARERIDPGLLRSLEELREATACGLGQLEEPMMRLDRSLTQALASAGGKIDYQLRRLEETVLAKGRQALFRRRPELAHLRELLRPRGKPQERVFTMWTPWLAGEEDAGRDLEDAVQEWLNRGECGHALLSIGRGGSP